MQTQINMGTWRRVNVSAFHLDYSLVQRLLEFEEAVNKLVAWSRGRVVTFNVPGVDECVQQERLRHSSSHSFSRPSSQ